MPEIEFLELKIKTVSLKISHTGGNAESKNKMSKFTDRTKKKKNDLTINKSDRFADILIQAVLPAKLQCQYLQLR